MRTNFCMPDLLSIAIGGGTCVRTDASTVRIIKIHVCLKTGNARYRIAGNFRKVPIFVIFVVDSAVMKISPCEN